MHRYPERDEWQVLLADFRTAAWCITCPLDQIDDETLLRTLGINDPSMSDAVRGWVRRYREILLALRARYPREPGTNDLRLGGVNWSEALGITYEGLRAAFIERSRSVAK